MTTRTMTVPRIAPDHDGAPAPALVHADGCRRPTPSLVWDALADRPAFVCPACWRSTATRPTRRT